MTTLQSVSRPVSYSVSAVHNQRRTTDKAAHWRGKIEDRVRNLFRIGGTTQWSFFELAVHCTAFNRRADDRCVHIPGP